MSTYDELYNIVEEEECEVRCYSCDFETTTDPEDCRVWAYGVYSIDDDTMTTCGNSIEGFVEWMECAANCKCYFHNLGFDGVFLMSYLLENGWLWVEERQKATDKTFTTCINDMNQVYQIVLYFTRTRYVTIQDSLKIIPLSVEAMARAYDLPIRKGTIDYEEYREPGHELTEDELAYLENDVAIVAKALRVYIDQKLTKMTAGSNALFDYKRGLGGHRPFRNVFPLLDEKQDAFLRKAYRGGFTYVNPRFQGMDVGDGIVLDVNSLYPSVMAACDGQPLPYGTPVWFDGEPEEDESRPLWVALVFCRFKVREDHIPCVQMKGNNRFVQTEYVEDSGERVAITVTNVDWNLMKQQYHLSEVEFVGGYSFHGTTYQFRDYVEKWNQVKVDAAENGNAGLRSVAKLMLNSLYGKLATRTEVKSRKPVLDQNGVLRYVDLDPESRDGVYLPAGIFVTSWARYKTITSAQKVYDRFIYADTDSLHLVGTEVPDELDVHPTKLGAWKHESTFDHGKFLRAKTYVEHEVGSDNLTVHVAGLPSRCHKNVTLENFEFGAVYEGALIQKKVKGGVVLLEGSKEIRR